MADDMNKTLSEEELKTSETDEFETEFVDLNDENDDSACEIESENCAESSSENPADGNGTDGSEDENESSSDETENMTGSEEASDEAVEDDPESTEKEEANGKSGFFKKKDKKEKKDKKDEQIADLTDKLKRSMAEFENFRKRTDKEKSQMYEIGASDVISKILPVIDNFERGLSTITEDKKDDPIASGMELIYKQLMTALSDLGVSQIPALNEQFDPNLHNAVMHVDDENIGENVIVEEFQKGYKYRDGIVRHSMVKVAN